jgi:hypothetical protein
LEKEFEKIAAGRSPRIINKSIKGKNKEEGSFIFTTMFLSLPA